MTETDIVIQWCVVGVAALVLLARGQLTLFHPTTAYLVFHGVAFCLRPTWLHVTGSEAMWGLFGIAPAPETLRLASHVSLAALIVFTISCSLVAPRAVRREPVADDEPRLDRADNRALAITALVFVPVGLAAALAEARDVASLQWLGHLLEDHPALHALPIMLVPIGLLLLVAAGWRWWAYLPFLFGLGERLLRGADPWIIALGLYLLIVVWLWDKRRHLPPIELVLVIPGLVILFAALSDNPPMLRSLLGNHETPQVRAEDEPPWLSRFDDPSLASFESLTFVVGSVPEKTGTFSFGKHYLTGISDNLAEMSGAEGTTSDFALPQGNTTRLAPTLAGDGWMGGGWWGVGVLLSLVGAGLGAAHRYTDRHAQSPALAVFGLTGLAIAVLFFRDGGLAFAPRLLFAGLPVSVWTLIARRLRLNAAVTEERQMLVEARARRRELSRTAMLDDEAPGSAQDHATPPAPSGAVPPSNQVGDETGSGESPGASDAASAGTDPSPGSQAPDPNASPDGNPRRPPRWRSDDLR